jgi:hypothetical protein
MMGERQAMQEALFYGFSLERHIPSDHLLRKIDRFVDLSGVRAHLEPYYSEIDRPSIDTELMIRMLIVGYCCGVRSERRLCEEVHLNLGAAKTMIDRTAEQFHLKPSRLVGDAGYGSGEMVAWLVDKRGIGAPPAQRAARRISIGVRFRADRAYSSRRNERQVSALCGPPPVRRGCLRNADRYRRARRYAQHFARVGYGQPIPSDEGNDAQGIKGNEND